MVSKLLAHSNKQQDGKVALLNVHDEQAQDEEEFGTSFLNDENAFPRSPNKKKCPEADQFEKEFMERNKKFEEMVFAPESIDVLDQNEEAPK